MQRCSRGDAGRKTGTQEWKKVSVVEWEEATLLQFPVSFYPWDELPQWIRHFCWCEKRCGCRDTQARESYVLFSFTKNGWWGLGFIAAERSIFEFVSDPDASLHRLWGLRPLRGSLQRRPPTAQGCTSWTWSWSEDTTWLSETEEVLWSSALSLLSSLHLWVRDVPFWLFPFRQQWPLRQVQTCWERGF